jgi:hypothetical protein
VGQFENRKPLPGFYLPAGSTSAAWAVDGMWHKYQPEADLRGLIQAYRWPTLHRSRTAGVLGQPPLFRDRDQAEQWLENTLATCSEGRDRSRRNSAIT